MPPGSRLALAVLAALSLSAGARAETPSALCSRVGTDDSLRPIPEALVPQVNALFGTRLPPQVAVATTVFRCASGRVMLCTTGANLTCGKADAGQAAGVGTVQWCRDHPEDDVVPAVATGHDTLFEWRCRQGRPEVVRQTRDLDRQGFIAQNWRELSAPGRR